MTQYEIWCKQRSVLLSSNNIISEIVSSIFSLLVLHLLGFV